MNREGIKKHRVVFDAWLDGAEVEYQGSDGRWHLSHAGPNWCSTIEYRVKPEPETREVWANVFPECEITYHSKFTADACAGESRVACVKTTITFTPGEGLDGGDS